MSDWRKLKDVEKRKLRKWGAEGWPLRDWGTSYREIIHLTRLLQLSCLVMEEIKIYVFSHLQ